MMKHQCFVLVHAKSCFSEEELGKLYEMALYEKWKLMLLEAHGRESILPIEQQWIFDRDLCELFLEDGQERR